MNDEYRSVIKSKMNNDTWWRNFKIRLVEIKEEYAKTEMTVTGDMNNFFDATHGAVIFALADQAFAAAANSRYPVSVALNMSISFIAPSKIGEKLVAKAEMISSTKRTGIYDIKVYGEVSRLIAICQGLVYRKGNTPKNSKVN